MLDPRSPSQGEPLPQPFGARRTSHAPLLAALLVALVGAPAAATALWAHNAMLGRAEAVDAAWAQVESSFQRRADLVPRLVETVNRAVRHESELLTEVTRERGAALAAARDALGELHRAHAESAAPAEGSPDEARLDRIASQQAALDRGVQSVLAVAERYPELRSADQFLELQAQLEGTENRIHVARMAFNDAVRDYNSALVQLPTRIVARAEGLERRPYFRADASARVARPLDLE